MVPPPPAKGFFEFVFGWIRGAWQYHDDLWLLKNQVDAVIARGVDSPPLLRARSVHAVQF
jgi:hypothetical protein